MPYLQDRELEIRRQLEVVLEPLAEQAAQQQRLNVSGWEKASQDVTINGIQDVTGAGLSGYYQIASISELDDYALYSEFKGSSLSDKLRRNARQASQLVESTVKQHTKSLSNWKRLTDALGDARVSRGDIPQYIRDIADLSRQLALSPGDDLLNMQLKTQIRTARQRALGLAQGGAPNRALKRAYLDVINVVENRQSDVLTQKLRESVRQKAIYNNQRIARTEMARMHNEAFYRRVMDDPNISIVRSRLSSRHNVVDACDMFANANLHGLGPGLYPKEQAPSYPYHPNCLCSQLTYAQRINDRRKARFSSGEAEKWLRNLPDHKKAQIMVGGFDPKNWRRDLKAYGGQLLTKNRKLPQKLVK